MKRTFYRPKLEAGVNATGWQPCSTYTGSLIRQTHDAILLEVDEIVSGVTEDYTQKIGALQVTADAISGQVSTISDTVSGHTEQIGMLVVKSDAISGAVSSLIVSESGTTQGLAALTIRVDGISGTVSSISDTVSGHTQQIASLNIKADAISGSVSNLSDTVSGHTQQIGSLTLRADEFQTEISELQTGEVGLNIIPANGWKNKDGEFVEPDEAMCYSASTSYIVSPKIYLDPGEYTVSNYNNQSTHFVVKYGDTTITPSSAYTAPNSDTYQGCNRYVDTFSATTSGDYTFTYGDNAHNSKFYRPKLEKGNTLTAYTQQQVQYSSLIDQTSQQITLEVTEQISENDAVAQFKRTGIDITNGKVEIDAENTYINGNLELRAQDDADALTLMDDNDVERATITSQEIGALSGQSMSTTQTWDYSGLLDYGDSTVITLGTKAFTANSVVTSGQQYGIGRVGYAILTYKDDNNQWQPQYIDNPNSCTIGIKLVNTSNPTIQYILPSQQVTYPESEGRYWLESRLMSSGSNKVVITTSGTYNIIATITWANNTQTSPFARQTKYQIWAYMQVDAVTKTLVGSDGMYSTNGMNNYMHFSKDGFHACDTSDSNNIIISSCGAAVSDKINPGGGQPIRTVDKWLDNGQKYTGPAHISSFKTGGPHWNLSQSYANVVSIDRTNGWYTESNPCVPLPSTDIILVENFFDDGADVWIDMAPMEYQGHIVTIRNFEHPLATSLKSSNGTRFHWYKQTGPSYTNQFEFGWDTKFPSSFEYTWMGGSRWHTSTWVYEDISGSSSYGIENGRWIMLNISTYTYSG